MAEKLVKFDNYACSAPHCVKTRRADGKSLFSCQGCAVGKLGVRYCSIECQRSDWPEHQVACERERQFAGTGMRDMAELERLVQWNTYRRAACTDAAGHALQLHLDPSRSQNEIFMIGLTPVESDVKGDYFKLQSHCILNVSEEATAHLPNLLQARLQDYRHKISTDNSKLRSPNACYFLTAQQCISATGNMFCTLMTSKNLHNGKIAGHPHLNWKDILEARLNVAVAPSPICYTTTCLTIKQDQICRSCSKKATDGRLVHCSGCQVAGYCDSSCQKTDWKGHKSACKANKLQPVVPLGFPWMPRDIQKWASGPRGLMQPPEELVVSALGLHSDPMAGSKAVLTVYLAATGQTGTKHPFSWHSYSIHDMEEAEEIHSSPGASFSRQKAGADKQMGVGKIKGVVPSCVVIYQICGLKRSDSVISVLPMSHSTIAKYKRVKNWQGKFAEFVDSR